MRQINLFLFHLVLLYSKGQELSCDIASTCDTERCSRNGICFTNVIELYNKTELNTSCWCNTGWTSKANDEVKCCYQRKKQSFAFLFEFMIGWGIGHFYVGNFFLGIIKLMSCVLLCCTFCVTTFFSCYREVEFNFETYTFKKFRLSKTIIMTSLCLYFGWHIADGVLYGINFYTDGNGVELEGW